MFGFFREVFSVVSKRGWWLVLLNWLFFGFVVIGSLLGNSARVDLVYLEPVTEVSPFEQINGFWLFGFIFVFNLVLSGFAFVTLTGLVFFVLSPVLLCVRGLLWGVLFAVSPSSRFLVMLPTIILEGEGYVFAGLAGLLLGLSWLKPDWAYEEEILDRSQALVKALKDTAYIYVLVALLLLAAAVAETITIVRL